MKNINKLLLFLFILFLITSCQPEPYKQGKVLYQYHCENCHMEDGSGLKRLIPSLEKSAVIGSSPDSLICLIRNGIAKNPLTGQEMPPNKSLNEVEMTNIVNYLRSFLTNHRQAIKVSEVREMLGRCP